MADVSLTVLLDGKPHEGMSVAADQGFWTIPPNGEVRLSLAPNIYSFSAGYRNRKLIFSGEVFSEQANEYLFDIGRSRTFASIDNSIAAAGTLGVQVRSADGSELLRDSYRMSNPAITARNGRAVAYDIGGTAVRVFSKNEIISQLETQGIINAVSINRNGWISVCTQESETYKGTVTVYDNQGRPVYKVNMVSGYVLSAEVSPDNRSVAVLNITDEGSRVTIYNLDSEEVNRVFDLPQELILDIRYLTGNEVLAISTESLFLINSKNEFKLLYEYSEHRLGGFFLDGDFIVLHLLEYSIGYRGKLITIDIKGHIHGEIEIDKEIISMSTQEGYLAILRNDGLIFYSKVLEELPISEEIMSTAGATEVLALRKDIALVAGDHFAYIIKIVN
jgi:WD40 repeat protein